jgi:hypothetical protein
MPELGLLVAGFTLQSPGFSLKVVHSGIVIDKVALWQFFFSEQFLSSKLFHQCPIIICHQELVQ